MLPINIVCATRLSERDFYQSAALGRSLAQAYPDFPFKCRIYFENKKPLPVCYNDAIAQVSGADEILLFIHDDIFLIDFYWVDRLIAGLEMFDVVGLAGNKRRLPRQPSWAFIDEALTWDDRSNLSGVVGHGPQFPCEVSIYGPSGQQCKLLDGLFLATKKSTLEKNQIAFDETFDFHFYDLDFCRQAEAHNVRMGTIPLCVIHQSGGDFEQTRWAANYEKYLRKWKE